MISIPLGNNLETLIDDADSELVAQYSWRAINCRTAKTFYAAANEKIDGRWKRVWMHKLILPVAKGFEVDHRDQNGLHNWRSNLRAATRSQNMANRASWPSASGYRGVYWLAKQHKFQAQIRVNSRIRSCGYFNDAAEAAEAYKLGGTRTFRRIRSLKQN